MLLFYVFSPALLNHILKNLNFGIPQSKFEFDRQQDQIFDTCQNLMNHKVTQSYRIRAGITISY
ncbi:hypothetical protein D1AOALGA4SA_7211 [Olavius algarvensis Delta 1 endosymbiont]|nr:hypothetical protein D1AOALGA4SA_7211 [Olavius algarvensis Delta 1 endosymbiont]